MWFLGARLIFCSIRGGLFIVADPKNQIFFFLQKSPFYFFFFPYFVEISARSPAVLSPSPPRGISLPSPSEIPRVLGLNLALSE